MPSSRRFEVLLVEDKESDEALVARAIQRTGLPIQLHVAHDGKEALDMLLPEQPAEARAPHLVLLDLRLPGVSGIDVLRKIRANPKTGWLPVVMLTCSDEPQDIRECYQLHTNSYLRKPLDHEEFIQAVSDVVKYWLTVNILPTA